MMLKLAIAITVAIVTVLLLLQIDDDLDPGVPEFTRMSRSKPNGVDSAYLYLLGINAGPGEAPQDVGEKIYTSLQQAEEHPQQAGGTFEYYQYPVDKMLPLPQAELFCDDKTQACLLSDGETMDAALQQHGELMQRYLAFLAFDHYSTPVISMEHEPIPPFQYLVRGNHMLILKAIRLAQTSHDPQAFRILSDNLSHLRRQLAQADTVISKVVFYKLIADNLDALSLLVHEFGYDSPQQLAELSPQEHDFSLPISREFSGVHDAIQTLDMHPETFFSTGEQPDGYTPAWLVRLVFKPNISINTEYRFFKQLAELSKLDHRAFIAHAQAGDSPELETAYVRNLAGTVLNNIAKPDYQSYMARLYNLDLKIYLFNQTTANQQLPEQVHLLNPYSDAGQVDNSAYYSDDRKRLCLHGPLEKYQDHEQRCLRVRF